MSKHAKPTLVRIFQNNERVANILVDDWEDLDGHARFTIPANHPRAHWMFNTIDWTAIVMDTEEIEWSVQRVVIDINDKHTVRFVSRRRRLLTSQPNDDWCIQLFGVEQ